MIESWYKRSVLSQESTQNKLTKASSYYHTENDCRSQLDDSDVMYLPVACVYFGPVRGRWTIRFCIRAYFDICTGLICFRMGLLE
jgi:hypothetical protein